MLSGRICSMEEGSVGGGWLTSTPLRSRVSLSSVRSRHSGVLEKLMARTFFLKKSQPRIAFHLISGETKKRWWNVRPFRVTGIVAEPEIVRWELFAATTCIWGNWERISREPRRIRSLIMETAAPVSTRKLDFLPSILPVIVSGLKLVESWVRTDKGTFELPLLWPHALAFLPNWEQ